MSYRLIVPKDQIVPETACFFRIHLGHRENAANLAANLIKKAAAIEKTGYGDDALLNELIQTGEAWALETILQGLYVREYHEWERAIKGYFANQKIWNGLEGDFDWRTGSKSMVKRTIEALEVFSASMDQHIMDAIDDVRRKVNEIKHDPLDHFVEQKDFEAAIKIFEDFWDKMMVLEGFTSTGAISTDTPHLSNSFIEQFNKALESSDPSGIVAAFRGMNEK
jgi:hypothetical protein